MEFLILQIYDTIHLILIKMLCKLAKALYICSYVVHEYCVKLSQTFNILFLYPQVKDEEEEGAAHV